MVMVKRGPTAYGLQPPKRWDRLGEFYSQEELAKIREHMREANRLASAEAKKRGVKLDPRIAKMRGPATPEGGICAFANPVTKNDG